MKIHKLSNVIAIPFALILFYILYDTFLNDNSKWLIYAFIPTSVLILLYLFQPQINYWWLSKYPIDIDDKIKSMLNENNSFYRMMDYEDKKLFENRLGLYVEAAEFTAKGMEQDFDVPYDVKMMAAQIPITIAWNKKDHFISSFERVVVYKHAFPSPRYKFLHTSETNIEDGVIIFALDVAEAAFIHPNQFYNVAWHAYIDAFIKTHPLLDYPTIRESDWTIIESCSGLTKEHITSTLGFKSVDILIVMSTIFFLYGTKLQERSPAIYQKFQQIFS